MSSFSCQRVPGNCACELFRMKGVLPLLGSVILNVANVVIVVIFAMLVCQSERNHKIDITGSGSFTFDYYNSVP